jgi:cyanophycinase
MQYDEKLNSCPEPAGILVIIGGKEDKIPEDEDENGKHVEILKSFIKLIEKKDPVVEVVTTASSEPDEMFKDYKVIFEKLQVTNLGHIHHNKREEVVDDKTLMERVNNADAFFFTGGDQLVLTSLYGGSDFLTRLKERYIQNSIVVAGTSAGAMALSTPMIYAGSEDVQQVTGEIKITTGLEFLKDVCIDTHFIDRNRFSRMAQVIASNPTNIGIGIEENTAIIVRKGTEASIIGESVVTIIEGFFISSSNITDFDVNQKINIQNMKVHLLSEPCTYSIPQINPPHK